MSSFYLYFNILSELYGIFIVCNLKKNDGPQLSICLLDISSVYASLMSSNVFLLKVVLNNSCTRKCSQRCRDFKRQLTCCHKADYKAFVMPFVIKTNNKQMPFVLMKQVLTVVKALAVWVYILWGL